MANIGESRTARLARERLESIKIFLPVRDRVREKLQAQQAQVHFATESEELFKPVTTATGKVVTVIAGIPDDDKPQKSLLQAIEPKAAQPEGAVAKGSDFKSKFTEGGIAAIILFILLEEKDIAEFSALAVDSYKIKFLKLGQDKGVNIRDWIDWVYKINQNIDRKNSREQIYRTYLKGASQYYEMITRQQQEQ